MDNQDNDNGPDLNTIKPATSVDKVNGIVLSGFLFQDYIQPKGWLTVEPASHALFYYYLLARKAYEEAEKNVLVYEGELDPAPPKYQQIFTSVATMYGVQPEVMVKFWNNVDLQCTVLKLPKMPHGDKYRFDKNPEIKTQ